MCMLMLRTKRRPIRLLASQRHRRHPMQRQRRPPTSLRHHHRPRQQRPVLPQQSQRCHGRQAQLSRFSRRVIDHGQAAPYHQAWYAGQPSAATLRIGRDASAGASSRTKPRVDRFWESASGPMDRRPARTPSRDSGIEDHQVRLLRNEFECSCSINSSWSFST